MFALSVQSLLLVLAAYFLGAALACMMRRSVSPVVRAGATAPAAAPERRVDPLPEVVAARSSQAAARPAAPSPAPGPAPAPAPAMSPAPAPAPVAPAPAAAAAPYRSGPQDLRAIRGIDAGVEARLKEIGITRYDQIAAWKRADVDRVSQVLGQKGRVARENWIEQAQILSQGGLTLFAVRRARGEGSTAAPTADEGDPPGPPQAAAASLPLPMSRGGVSATVVAPATETAPGAPAEAVPIRPSAPPARDDLKRIGGITAEIEQRLNALGVSRYTEIAQWSPAAVERVDKELTLNGRISRENWIEQAHILSRGGDTRFSLELERRAQAPTHAQAGPPPRPIKLPDAIREHEAAKAAGRTDLSGLRSVRSEAYQDATEPGPEAARRAASRRLTRGGQPDDLKRIRGIGVMIEKRLNALGVTTYEDIANWTAADIERISHQLDFKGRIERENWVEQARILAAGGDTEFSRRTDRDGRK